MIYVHVFTIYNSLEAVHPEAYKAFQVSNDLESVIKRCLGLEVSPGGSTSTSPSKLSSDSKITLSLMTPVLPMLVSIYFA